LDELTNGRFVRIQIEIAFKRKNIESLKSSKKTKKINRGGGLRFDRDIRR
jgi:hypothetical protein